MCEKNVFHMLIENIRASKKEWELGWTTPNFICNPCLPLYEILKKSP